MKLRLNSNITMGEDYPIFYKCTGCDRLYFCFDKNPTYAGQKCPCNKFDKPIFQTERYEQV